MRVAIQERVCILEGTPGVIFRVAGSSHANGRRRAVKTVDFCLVTFFFLLIFSPNVNPRIEALCHCWTPHARKKFLSGKVKLPVQKADPVLPFHLFIADVMRLKSNWNEAGRKMNPRHWAAQVAPVSRPPFEREIVGDGYETLSSSLPLSLIIFHHSSQSNTPPMPYVSMLLFVAQCVAISLRRRFRALRKLPYRVSLCWIETNFLQRYYALALKCWAVFSF